MNATWSEVLKYVVFGIIAILGSPFTQWLKNQFKLVDRWALLLTGVVSAAFAVLELTLANLINWQTVTLATFPNIFFMVFGVSTIYFAWFKGTESVLGKNGLLKGS
jgi:uncharacterized membrane protein HdeD (DUF308 family)